MEGSVCERADLLTTICKDIAAWESSLDDASLEGFKEQVDSKLDEIFDGMVAAMGEKLLTETEAHKLQASVLEFGYAFPHKAKVQEVLHSLRQFLLNTQGDTLLKKLMGEADACIQLMEKGSSISDAPSPLLQAMDQCKGLRFEAAEALSRVEGHVETWLHAGWRAATAKQGSLLQSLAAQMVAWATSNSRRRPLCSSRPCMSIGSCSKLSRCGDHVPLKPPSAWRKGPLTEVPWTACSGHTRL